MRAFAVPSRQPPTAAPGFLFTRKRLKLLAKDKTKTPEERFAARLKLAEMPRNGSKVRIRNRCEITGRPRGNYRKLKMCRNQLRELASQGRIPGMVKSSW